MPPKSRLSVRSEGLLFADFYGLNAALSPRFSAVSTRHFATRNPVGYANNDAGKPAQQCLSASFKTIGLTWTDEEGNKCEGVCLADLKFIGYDVNEDGIGDIWTDNLVINMLHTDGSNLYDE